MKSYNCPRISQRVKERVKKRILFENIDPIASQISISTKLGMPFRGYVFILTKYYMKRKGYYETPETSHNNKLKYEFLFIFLMKVT